MGSSEFLIVVCSPRSAKSQWVNREVAWFKTHRDPANILTVIVDGEPMASLTPGREAEECFPKTLLYKVDADLQPTTAMEDAPLAADARETGDGRRGAKLKLAAAMLGVGFDALQRRDDRRRAQRRRIVMGAMAASIALLGGLTIFAFNQRNAAIAARNEAVAARNDARFQRDEAQSLVEFMLTDLRQRLDAVGRLDILDAVAERLNESYAKQDLTKLDADALGRRARVQLLLGEVDNTRGDLDAALAQYKEAAATTEELLTRNPDKAQQIFDHAQSVFWVGYIAWQRGDAETARRYWTQYHDQAQRLVEIDPDNDDWQAELEYSYSNLGTLELDEGNAETAETWFRKSLGVSSALVKKYPDDTERLLAAGQSYAWLADSLYRQSKFSDAFSTRKHQLAVYSRANNVEKKNIELVDAKNIAGLEMVRILTATGEINSAVSLASDTMEKAIAAALSDQSNINLGETAITSHSIVGELFFYLLETENARESLAGAFRLSKNFSHTPDMSALWNGRFLPQAKLVLAKLEAHEGHQSNAIRLFDEVSSEIFSLMASDSADIIMERRYCEALVGRARLSPELSDYWASIIATLEPKIRQHGPEAQALLAEAYARTGRDEKARSLIDRLYAAGYRHPDFMAMLAAFPQLHSNDAAAAATP